MIGGSGMNTPRDDDVPEIPQINISGMQTQQVYVGALNLTADQLSQFSTINTVGNPRDLVAAGARIYDLAGKTPDYLGRQPDRRQCQPDRNNPVIRYWWAHWCRRVSSAIQGQPEAIDGEDLVEAVGQAGRNAGRVAQHMLGARCCAVRESCGLGLSEVSAWVFLALSAVAAAPPLGVA